MAGSQMPPVFEHGLHRHPHVRHPVERVEDAEDVHAGRGGFLAELADDVVGIARVADGVAGPKQHLKQDVRDLLAQVRQPLPGIFLEEPQGRVERRPAPHLQRKQARWRGGHRRRRCSAGRACETAWPSSDWCASRNVVSVSSSCFCFRIHSPNFSGPSSFSLSRVPGGGGCVQVARRAPARLRGASPWAAPSRADGR